MSFIQWSDQLSVNVTKLDTQHQRLIAMINALHEAMKERRGRDVVGDILEGLKDYARTHFALEEEYMAKTNYPDFNIHRVEHDKFIEKVLDFDLEMQEGKASPISLSSFLREWLLKHIKGTDKKYAAHFNAKGIL